MTTQLKTINFNRSRALIMASCAGALMLLGACDEAEVILPGKREDIRSVLQNADAPQETASDEQNVSRAISLGAMKNNRSWAQGIGNEQNRVSHAALASDLQLQWSSNIGDGDSRKYRITADPVAAHGVIYTLDAQTKLSATDQNGNQLWQVDIRPERDNSGDATGGGLVIADGVVYVTTGFGELVALQAQSGDIRWRQQLNATSTGQPMVHDGLIYVVVGDSEGWVINAQTGRIEWQTSGSQSISNVLGAPAPVIGNDFAIFAFGSGEIQASFRRGGLRRWTATVLGERVGHALSKINDVTGSPVVDNGVLYAGNQAGRTVALDVNSGAHIWSSLEGAIGPVWPAGDSIFMISDKNELLRLDASDGSRIWGHKLPNYVKERPKKISEVFAHHGPIVAGGRVYVASNDGVLRGFDPRDGALSSSTQMPAGASTAPIVMDKTLYVVGRKGQLHAFR